MVRATRGKRNAGREGGETKNAEGRECEAGERRWSGGSQVVFLFFGIGIVCTPPLSATPCHVPVYIEEQSICHAKIPV